jgi:hypothetical protein
LLFSACSKLEDLNVNKKDFTVVSGASLFNGAALQLINELSSTNVSVNNTNTWMQHLANTTYPEESQYDMTGRNGNGNHLNTMYRLVLVNLKDAARVLKTEPLAGTSQAQRNNQLAIVEIMSVLAWSNIVECWGDMPYTQAFDINYPSPVYDDGLTIYKDLISRLTAAIGIMTPSFGGFAAGDNINGGSAAGTVKWIKFANALKLRMGLMLADKDNAYAKTIVEAAAPNVFVAGDKVVMNYATGVPNQNQQYLDFVSSGREDYVVTSNLINAMQPTTPADDILTVTVADPRLPFYATTVGGKYVGGRQGQSNGYSDFSHVNPINTAANREWIIMDYVETEFLLAEAVARGFSVVGTVETHYNNAIRASIIYWGGTTVQADAYLAQPTVAYTTAVGDWKQKIGVQAWLSYYLRGYVAWNSWRRLDYPRLKPSPEYRQGINKVPVRLSYPVSEQTLNNANYTAAAAKIGGDNALTRLFWDTAGY